MQHGRWGVGLLVLVGWSQVAWGWSAPGHLLLTQIAYDRLGPTARRQMDDLADELPGRLAPYNAITAACWLDDTRSPATERWHYVDAPFSPDGDSFTEPSGPDALRAYARALTTLQRPSASRRERARALAVVVHLVGDLHQPLHCVDRRDRGGNEVAMVGVPGVHNLHQLWDRAYALDDSGGLARSLWPTLPRPDQSGTGAVKAAADELLRGEAAQTGVDTRDLRPLTWARESHRLACREAYTLLQPEGPALRPAPGYLHRAQTTAQRRLVAAGLRLALVLDGALREGSRAPARNPARALLGAAFVLLAVAGLLGWWSRARRIHAALDTTQASR